MFSSIVYLLHDIVRKYPDQIALQTEVSSCSYKKLWEEVLACAKNLKKNGINKGDRVALLMDNSIEYAITYYGIVSCGGVVVSFNTRATTSEIMNWVDHSEVEIIVADSGLENKLQFENNVSPKTISIKSGNVEFWSGKESGFESFSIEDVEEHDLVSIIYTSGTTGFPKGVMLTHNNFVCNLTEVIEYLGLSSEDSILNILPFYYSYGNSVLHTHLLSGAKIYIENNFMYPVKTMRKIVDHKITGFSGVPATFSILLNRVKLEDFNLTGLRYVTQAGGAMPVPNIHKLVNVLKHTLIYVMYGQTEATARISYLNPDMLIQKIGSVGKPLKSISVQIRDKSNNILAPGVEGELFVKGPNIMSGYWRNSRLTNEVVFDGYLKTGDLGYIDTDGYIYLTGRRSDMIKVGGNRISPLEIEEVVVGMDGVEEVAATGVDDDILGQVVKLTIVKSSDSDISVMKIKAYCRKKLALYKVPKHINFIDKLPKTASGKIKRFLL